MYEKSSYIQSNQNKKEEDPIEKLNISLNQLLFSLKNKEVFPSTDIEPEINSEEEGEDIEQIKDNEGENLLNQYENLNNINKNNSNISHDNNDNKINKKIIDNDHIKNIRMLLGKIKEIKNENLGIKNEIEAYQNTFNEMIKIVINGAMMKETEINEKYKNIVDKLKKELEISKQKMSKLDIDYKKQTKSNLQKFNNIINNNKIQKEQIEKNFQESIEKLEQEKNELIKEKNNLIEEQKNKNDELNKLNDELIALGKENQRLIQENENLKVKINELNQNIDIIIKNNEENIEKIISEKDQIMNQLTKELESANTKIINQNKQIIQSKLKIEELQKWKTETKITLKQYEKDKNRLNELEKLFIQFQNLKNENKNTLKNIEKIKTEKILLNKQNIVQKDLIEKYKNINNDLNKEKEENKNNIEKLNKEIYDLKYSKNKLKSLNESIHHNDESAHKLRTIIENLKKKNKELEEQNNELLKRIEIKEKTGKKNKELLNKERKPHKFENLHKINLESFIFKRNKNNKHKFIVSNNVRTITSRLYPKINKTDTSSENKDKIIIINKQNLKLNDKNFSNTKNIHKKKK